MHSPARRDQGAAEPASGRGVGTEAAATAGSRLPQVPWASWTIPRRYDQMSIIGQGAYGTVCQADDREGNRLVAIKQVRNLMQSLENCKRTLRELSILRQLDHDCVVRLYDVFLPRGAIQLREVFIVMEICDSDMKKLIESDVTLHMDHLRHMLYNLLKGLKYLGSAGVIHRDLKPGNVLVNQNCSVKICDFNLACVVDEGTGDANAVLDEPPAIAAAAHDLTRPIVPSTMRATRQLTQRVVTRWYRAPEVILLQARYTKAIDMWGVGCVFGELLQMLEGGVPVDDRSPLFPGTHCFPLSPHPRRQARRRDPGQDLLFLIFQLLGTPSEGELQRLDREDARAYVRTFPAADGRGLQARLPWVDGPALDILGQMLRFDAQGRLSASEALEHELFADVRSEEEETAAPAPIALGIEHESSIDEYCLRRHLLQEARRFGSPVWEGAAGGA